MHLHVGRKLAGLHDGMGLAGPFNKQLVLAPSVVRCSRLFEAGTVTTAGVGCQGELAHDQQAAMGAGAIDILHAQVHLTGRIAEDAQLENFGQQLFRFGLRVALLGANQHQQFEPF